jgi:nicotinate-nucleotide pyrophosphorylase (carboxylating)
MRTISRSRILPQIRAALQEDRVRDDATTAALFPRPIPGRAVIRAKQPMTVAGIEVAGLIFQTVDPALRIRKTARDGARIETNAIIMVIEGDSRALLKAERTALNFLQRMSGIATLTARYVAAVRGTKARIFDTRKTAPGLRLFDKWAVRLGGGTNHRESLADAVMIKDNHLALLRPSGLDAGRAIHRARARAPRRLPIIVEADTLAQVRDALNAAPDVILLDNMSPRRVRAAVALIDHRARVEVSGGITLTNVRQMAKAGADRISVGALTHSAPAADLSMEISPLPARVSRRVR